MVFPQPYADIYQERRRQDQKWGAQAHIPAVWLAILGEEVGEVCKALLEDKRADYRTELVHVAAVATAAIEAFDRGEV